MFINVTYDASVDGAPTGFKETVAQVAAYFQATFSDPITINIPVGYGEVGGGALPGGAIGASLTYVQSLSYTSLRSALAADSKTPSDATAVASLPGSDPAGNGHYWMSRAEGKALGLVGASTFPDGYTGFSSAAGLFDYNNSDGVSPGQYDFYGVVAHEFTEVMGRMLFVGGTIGQQPNSYDALDLFHFSSPGVRAFSLKGGYFSIDGGSSSLNSFNANSGGDAGDWAGATYDAFNAFGSSGVVLPVSSVDLTEMDVIGWDAAPPPPPPPPPPDLTAANLALSILDTGTSASFQINNIGSGSAAASTAGVYLSSDSTITTADTLIGSYSTPALAAGGVDPETASLSFPTNLTPGTYYIGALADSDGAVAETDETNNASGTIPVIVGNDSDNSLTGTSGNDTIFGLGGDDILIGGAGNDTLIGGLGADHFRFNAPTEGTDTITDFIHGADTLDFSRWPFGFQVPSGTALSDIRFIANATGPANTTQRFWYDTNADDPAHFHTLYYDRDGSGTYFAPVAMAVLGVNVDLTASDIHLV